MGLRYKTLADANLEAVQYGPEAFADGSLNDFITEENGRMSGDFEWDQKWYDRQAGPVAILKFNGAAVRKGDWIVYAGSEWFIVPDEAFGVLFCGAKTNRPTLKTGSEV